MNLLLDFNLSRMLSEMLKHMVKIHKNYKLEIEIKWCLRYVILGSTDNQAYKEAARLYTWIWRLTKNWVINPSLCNQSTHQLSL